MDIPSTSRTSLSNDEIVRYSRQIAVPECGPLGQVKLKQATVLIVGAGGLGCPVGAYLAGAGIGRIDVLDYDTVDRSNLHRQVMHSESRVDMAKVESLAKALRDLNSDVDVRAVSAVLNVKNAAELITTDYTVVLDCTDNVPTRYLLNDMCVLRGLPLVSASALRWDGQLCVFNYKGGLCYRCLYPVPPPAHSVMSCSEGGVLGPVPGCLGTLQALEAMKVIAEAGEVCNDRLLVFNGLNCSFRSIRLRPRNAECVACGENSSVRLNGELPTSDYLGFCGANSVCEGVNALSLLNTEERISWSKFIPHFTKPTSSVLIDVRPRHEFEICSISQSACVPLKDLEQMKCMSDLVTAVPLLDTCKHCFLLCHRGNDSQLAVRAVQQLDCDSRLIVRDIVGGLESYSLEIDPSFPKY